MKGHIYNFSLISLLALNFLGFDDYIIIFIFVTVTLIRLLTKFGTGIVLLELVVFMSILIYLLAAILGYEVYNASSKIAILWDKVMPVDKKAYFDFMLPAIIAFAIGLNLHFSPDDNIDEGKSVENILTGFKDRLQKSNVSGLLLSLIGIGFYLLNKATSGALGYMGILCFFCLYPGLLYLFFTPNHPTNKILIALNLVFIIYDALTTGMFTMVAYMGATMFSIVFLGRKFGWQRKLFLFIGGLFFILIVQSIKSQVRNSKSVSNTFNVTNSEELGKAITADGFFPMYTRIAQSYYAAAIIKRFPEKADYLGGKPIAVALGAAFVPRIFWPDKPKSGGIANMKLYLNFNLSGYSINIGPPAECYANFGVIGGVFGMFFFGLLIRFFYRRIFVIAKSNPLVILWIPLIFFQVMYCMENDIMQAINSVLKSSVFVYVLSKAIPDLFVESQNN